MLTQLLKVQWWRRLIIVGLAGLVVTLPAASLAPAASAVVPSTRTICGNHRWFGGKHYCPATMEGILKTGHGPGRRVWLYDVIVESVDQDQVVVSQQRGPICDQGTCDFYLVGTSIPWKGTHRPVAGTTITLFGTTTQGGLVPAGYTVFGFCDDPYHVPC